MNVETLKTIQPIFFYIIISFTAGLIFYNRKNIFYYLKKHFSKKKLLISIVVFSILTLFTSFVSPKRERILYDEDIYINTAQCINNFHKNSYCTNGKFVNDQYFCTSTRFNKQPPGYPLTLSLYFNFTGVSRFKAFFFNNIVFIANIILIFFIVHLLTKDFHISLLSIILFSFVPITAHWHNSAAAEPTAIMYLNATALSFLSFYKNKKLSLWILSTMFFSLSVFVRYELILIIFPILAFLILDSKTRSFVLKNFKFFILSILALFIAISPILIQFFIFRNNSWGATDQSKFSIKFFRQNFHTNIKFFTNPNQFPIVALPIFLLGIFITKRNKFLEFFFASFAVTFGVYLFFYAGSYEYGADIRYALISLPSVAIIFALSLWRISKKFNLDTKSLFYILIPLFLNLSLLVPHMRYRGEEGWQALWDVDFIQNQIKPRVKKQDYIFTNTPYSYHISRLNGRSTDSLYNKESIKSLLENTSGRKIYFHHGYWCSLDPEDINVANFCQDFVANNYKLTEVYSETRRGVTYTLYEIIDIKN